MYCTSCGKKLKEGSRFCSYCGAAVTRAATGAADVADAREDAANAQGARSTFASARPEQGDIKVQVKQMRKRSRRMLPVPLIVALVALALAGAALAATYIYTTYIAPAQEQAATEQPAETDGASTEGDAPQTEAPAEEEQERPESVYDDTLQKWIDAANDGWPEVSDDDDLANVSDVVSGRATFLGNAHEGLTETDIKYAYKDLNGDDVPELVFGVKNSSVTSGAGFEALAVYTSKGEKVTSATDGQGWQTSVWTLYKSGYIVLSGGGNAGGTTYYKLKNGKAVKKGEYTNRELFTGSVDAPDFGKPYKYKDFDWKPLV